MCWLTCRSGPSSTNWSIPYEADEVSRLIVDTHDAAAFAPIASLTVGGFREWLLSNDTDGAAIAALAPGLTPEMAAAVSKLMRNQDLVAVARKIHVVTAFRSTIGLPGRLSVRLQPNHPTDDPAGIAASILDGLLMGSGDAVIGINPASDSIETAATLIALLDEIREAFAIPTQSCVLAHVTTTLALIARERRSISASSRLPGPRPPIAASASTSRCSTRRTRRPARSGAARSATM